MLEATLITTPSGYRQFIQMIRTAKINNMKPNEIKPNMPVYNVAEKYSGAIIGRTDDPEIVQVLSSRRIKNANAEDLREISSPNAVFTDITPTEFAALRGVSLNNITRKIKSGQLFPGMIEVRKFGRAYVITVDEKMIKKGRHFKPEKPTDLENFVSLYKSFGIDCIVNTDGSEQVILLNGGEYSELKATRSEKFGGYSGCSSEVRFDSGGKFTDQSFWEIQKPTL